MSHETQSQPPEAGAIGSRLNALLDKAGLPQLNASVLRSFETYLSLFVHWNSRINLTSVRDEDGILTRHFVESIACAHALPPGIATLLDFGSGGGFPGIPIALCRPEIAVTLAESNGKKAAFLQEAVRVVGLPSRVHSGRAEALTRDFDCVAMRAVDKMLGAVSAVSPLVAPGGSLVLMTTANELSMLEAAAGPDFLWSPPTPLPYSHDRIIAIGAKVDR
jgi:16S rRNA (guanine527-N7)-methyltransferase